MLRRRVTVMGGVVVKDDGGFEESKGVAGEKMKNIVDGVDERVKTIYSPLRSRLRPHPFLYRHTRNHRERRFDPHQRSTRIGSGVRARCGRRWSVQFPVDPLPALECCARAGGLLVGPRLDGSGVTGWRERVGAYLPSSLCRGPDTARFRAFLLSNPSGMPLLTLAVIVLLDTVA